MSNQLPHTIDNEIVLEDLLSQPSEAALQSLRRTAGDVIVLGAGGKMGPSLTRMLRRAADQVGTARRIIGVSRFSDDHVRQTLEQYGVNTIRCDLLSDEPLTSLPEVPNVILMTGYKFGTSSNPSMTWATNVFLTAEVCRRYRRSRIVVFSSGNLYAMMTPASGGSLESDTPQPAGEYAMTTLGRERMTEHFSRRLGMPAALIRLNYAVELRYGVLLDLARQVYHERPIDLTMGHVNVIWQADANAMAIAALADASSPPYVLNVAGPEMLNIKDICQRFGKHFNKKVQFVGYEGEAAFLNNGSRGHAAYGRPRVAADRLVDWTAAWLAGGGPTFDKPTHFEVPDGKF